jgi:hypothetical protein
MGEPANPAERPEQREGVASDHSRRCYECQNSSRAVSARPATVGPIATEKRVDVER